MAKLKTGRHTSALKENRKANRRAVRNQAVRSKLSTLIKRVEALCAKKDAAAVKDVLNKVFSELDKAAKRDIIHSNKASNLKARLSKLVSGISAQAKK